ncbi:hypothetical protein AB0F46_21885 [Streptomyces sp. NPDC026665]|uniref:hypothetical protein n=1 Tax=Streptomyces sp. NPDC026665 TaxID=3154798 RepID=UPI0033EFBBE7
MLGSLLLDRRTHAAVRPLLAAHLTTATDVLRLLQVWSGGEADLLEPRRLRSPPRPLRRELLSVLDGFTATPLGEALLRTAAAHPEAVRIDGTRIRPDSWGAHTEQAL